MVVLNLGYALGLTPSIVLIYSSVSHMGKKKLWVFNSKATEISLNV